MFSKALLNATYVNGKPLHLTKQHEKAEHHRFKEEYLFKHKEIPSNLYAFRLIQQFLIIKALETKLQSLSNPDSSEISAFFALTYLEHLWRTPAMEDDLRQLGVNPNAIQPCEIAKTTSKYLKDIEQLTPKQLLGHFLLHVAGFMHGGYVIQSKYIRPSNKLTSYQIPAKQYDFSTAISFLSKGKHTSLGLYQDMMDQVDEIVLNEGEYQDILNQCHGIYETMTGIYDDLCDMHTRQPKSSGAAFAILIISLAELVAQMPINCPRGVNFLLFSH